MNERHLQTKVLRYLKNIPDSFTMKLSDRWTSGYPDILFIYKGKAIFFELKSTKGKAIRLQLWTMEKLHNAGAETYIIKTMDELKKSLDKVQD